MHKSNQSVLGPPTRSSSASTKAPLTAEQRQARQKYFDELKKTTSCHHCGKFGHWQGECPDLTEAERLEIRRNRRSRSNSATPSSRSFLAIEQSPELPDHEITHTGFMAFEQTDSLDLTLDPNLISRHHIWYANSAASSHMTNHRDWFASYSAFPDRYWPIQGIAPEPLYAAGIGTIAIERLINSQWQPGYIESVLHVLHIGSNLFSITKAAKKYILTTFSSHSCTMTSGGVIVLQGTLQNNLYELQLRVVSPPTDNALVAASFCQATTAEARQSLKVWHARLCHINIASIKLLVRQELADGIELLYDDTTDNFCEGSCYGKQHRTSFPVNPVRNIAANPGDLLHADIMGPMDTESFGGAFYCCIVKDDATGYRIAFSLKHKSDALSALQQACRQVLRDTGYYVQVLQTNRGGEFVSKQAKKFSDENLIREELTSPHTGAKRRS